MPHPRGRGPCGPSSRGTARSHEARRTVNTRDAGRRQKNLTSLEAQRQHEKGELGAAVKNRPDTTESKTGSKFQTQPWRERGDRTVWSREARVTPPGGRAHSHPRATGPSRGAGKREAAGGPPAEMKPGTLQTPSRTTRRGQNARKVNTVNTKRTTATLQAKLLKPKRKRRSLKAA